MPEFGPNKNFQTSWKSAAVEKDVMMRAFVTAVSADIDIRYGLHPEIKTNRHPKKRSERWIRIDNESLAEWREEDSGFSLEVQQRRREREKLRGRSGRDAGRGQAAVWTLCRLLCCGSVHLASKERFKHKFHLSNWVGGERAESLRKSDGRGQNDYWIWWRQTGKRQGQYISKEVVSRHDLNFSRVLLNSDDVFLNNFT